MGFTQAFCDLEGDMDLAEEFIKAMALYTLDHCAEDMAFFGKFVDKGLDERLKFVLERPFVRVPYAEAIEILKLNVDAYPASANVYDSLAEAYMEAGEKVLAVKNYARSVELNPDNRNAIDKLNVLVKR